jgi:branched-chain amino acid transport system permease protein
VLIGVIGGIGTILGPAMGAIVFVVLQEFLLASYPQLYLGLYGLLLILVILFEPLGLSGLLMRLGRRFGIKPSLSAASGGMSSAASAPDQGGAPDPTSVTPAKPPGVPDPVDAAAGDVTAGDVSAGDKDEEEVPV